MRCPLKIVIDNAQFIMEVTATEVKPMKLEQSFFLCLLVQK